VAALPAAAAAEMAAAGMTAALQAAAREARGLVLWGGLGAEAGLLLPPPKRPAETRQRRRRASGDVGVGVGVGDGDVGERVTGRDSVCRCCRC
jgi:hypothetical protein